MTDITKLTIAETLDGLKNKQFSATDLTKAYLQAMEDNRSLNAYVLETPEMALKQATEAEKHYASGTNRAWEGIRSELKICSVPRMYVPRLVRIY